MHGSKPLPPKDEPEEVEQPADVESDRIAPGKAAQKPPLPINEIEDLEGDVEGG